MYPTTFTFLTRAATFLQTQGISTRIRTAGSVIQTATLTTGVPNLMVFFARNGKQLATSQRAEDYSPGDIVAWDLGGGVTHIGIVVDEKGSNGRFMVVHNIGRGPQMEDVLFGWKIIGHYRYYGPHT